MRSTGSVDQIYSEQPDSEKIFSRCIFYNKCQFVGLLSDAYLESASVMLTDPHFYVNREFIMSFADFCQKIQLCFGGLE